MNGAAIHYRITASEAVRMAEAGMMDPKAVRRAIDARYAQLQSKHGKDTEFVNEMSPETPAHADYMEMDVYEFYGETPFRGDSNEINAQDGISRRVITVMGGETTRSRPWPRRMPFTEIKIIPRALASWSGSIRTSQTP